MNVLLDTNILGRMAEPAHAQYQVALDATSALVRRGDSPCLVPQVLYEFWVVATRPVKVNGLGLSIPQAATELTRVQGIFHLLPELPSFFAEWERLVTTHQVAGKAAHDARLVAAMAVHGLSHILTFNVADFTRYPGITAIDPTTLVPTP